MRIGIIVSDFPKVTETFVLRDLVYNHRAGHEMRIFHLTPYRTNEVVHGFAEQTLAWAVTLPFLFDRRVAGACWRALRRQPWTLSRMLGEIVREFIGEPRNLIKSLAIVPKSLAIAENLADWEVDHVHAEFAGFPATSAWIVGRMTGLPYSVSCHAHGIFLTQALLRQKLSEATFVRCISEFNRRFLIDRFPELEAQRMPVIHVGVDTGSIVPLEPNDRHSLRLLFIGSLEVRKGVSVLLRSLARIGDLREWRCDIVGTGPDRERLVDEARVLTLGDRVTFHGARPFEEVSRFMADSDLLLVPSIIGPGGRTEGIPTVIMESLAHQRPVIASRLTGIPELIEDGLTGYLVPPGDVDALANAIRTVAGNPASATLTARAGRERVVREFDMATNAQTRLQLYGEYRRGAAMNAAVAE